LWRRGIRGVGGGDLAIHVAELGAWDFCVTVDGSAIWDSPVEFGDFSHYFAGFYTSPRFFAGFLPSTVVSGE